jgi:hypothetical protein
LLASGTVLQISRRFCNVAVTLTSRYTVIDYEGRSVTGLKESARALQGISGTVWETCEFARGQHNLGAAAALIS